MLGLQEIWRYYIIDQGWYTEGKREHPLGDEREGGENREWIQWEEQCDWRQQQYSVEHKYQSECDEHSLE